MIQEQVTAVGFADFFKTTVSGMLARALVLSGHRSDAEDAVAEAYCEALARWERVSRYNSPEGWVHRVMRQRLRRLARRRARQVPVGLELPVPTHAGPERAAGVREVLCALAGLPPRQHLVMLLSMAGLSPAQIAAELGVTRGTVGVHLFRARRALEQELGIPPGQRRALSPLRRPGCAPLPADLVAAAVRAAMRWLEESVEARAAARSAIRARVNATPGARRRHRRARTRRPAN